MIVRNSPFPPQVSMNSQDKKVNDKEKVADNAPDSQDSQVEQVAEADKVSDIKQQIDNGTYKIDINKTADKMAQDLLLDIRVYKDSQRNPLGY